MDDQLNSRWEPVKVDCIICSHKFITRVPPNVPPELGKVVVCPKCLQKYLRWNNRLFTIHEVKEEAE
jgi:hypothetical protein